MKGLVMSGGGSKGAFTQGVLVEMARCGLEYDFISGVSVGALQTGMISQFPIGEFRSAVEALDAIWLGIKGDSSIYKRWLWGKLAGLVSRNAFYNSKPLHEIIKANVRDDLAQASGRKIRVGCCSYGKGHYWEAQENTPQLWRWVAASSGFAPFLLPISIMDDLWMDGGYRCVTPLKSAIEAGCEKIDVVLTGPPKTSEKDPHDNWLGTKITAFTIGMRCVDLMSSEVYLRDIEYALAVNKLVEAAHPDYTSKKIISIRIFMPHDILPGTSLDFDPALLRKRREHGIEVAKKILSEGAS